MIEEDNLSAAKERSDAARRKLIHLAMSMLKDVNKIGNQTIRGSNIGNDIAEVFHYLKQHDHWTKLTFLVNGNFMLEGKSPLDILLNDPDGLNRVIKATTMINEHKAF